MNCDNIFCVYNLEKNCSIDNVTMDANGMCQDCIYINLEDKILNQQKLKILNRIKNKEG